MNRYEEMLQRDVKDKTGATYYSVGVISAIVESEDAGESKIEQIKQVIAALENFKPQHAR